MPSRITFGIAKRRGWDATTNILGDTPQRASDCYVFCLFTEKDRAKAADRVLDVDAWQFFVVATQRIDQELGEQKSIGLSGVTKLAEPLPYARLKATIDDVVAST